MKEAKNTYNKIILPAICLLLALAAFYLKGIQLSIHLSIAKLYAIDTIDEKIRIGFVDYQGKLLWISIGIAILSLLLAIASMINVSNKLLGIILLLISGFSILATLFIM